MRSYSVFLLSALAFAACASEAPPDTSSSGPTRVLADAIERHAEQFDRDVPIRSPGSEEELAAGSYILGHLQQAGYVPLLDSVPVGDLVESTNVVALPVNGADPEALVAVNYGTTDEETGGEAIGVFLEIARALNAADPDHSVAFVALGAVQSPRLGPSLGTRRLLQYLSDAGFSPHVITLGISAGASEIAASGAHADEIVAAAGSGRVVEPPFDDLFPRARLEHTSVSGPPAEVGAALLDYLDD